MEDTIQTMQNELDTLLDEGFALFTEAIQGSHGDHPLTFMKKHATYQSWYAKALRVIRQLYPELADDFQAHYRAILSMPSLTKSPSMDGSMCSPICKAPCTAKWVTISWPQSTSSSSTVSAEPLGLSQGYS